jgi:hypothetical protein
MNTAQAQPTIASLAEIVFGKGETPVFAVLDGASIPDLVKKLYDHEPEYCCLYRGELPPDMAAIAPYLVRLEPGDKFVETVFSEGWGSHWGIFFASAATLRTLRDHLREFHAVELPDQRTVIFRYYDPRVLSGFLPACNADELAAFFGPIERFVVEGETPQIGANFSFAGKALKSETFELKKEP